jgi:hypothetical protein
MVGGADLINVSANPCKLWNQVGAQLSDATGAIIARLDPAISAGGSGAGVVAIPPGGDVTGTLVWMNWCGAGPKLPLRLTVYIADPEDKSVYSPALTAEVRDWEPGGSGIPRCDAPGADSKISAISFAPPEPSSGGYQPEPCADSALAAFSGAWGAGMGSDYANLVVLNVGGVDCIISTSPPVELRDAKGALLASAPTWPDPPTTVVLPAGWTADARIFYADWCIAPPAQPLQLDLVVSPEALLPIAHSDSDAAAVPVPFCLSAPATPSPAFGYDAPFSVPGASVAPPPDPVDSLPLAIAISALPVTAPGSVLTYTLTLTNISPFDKPMNIAFLCPSYVERLFLPNFYASIDTTRALNCGPAGTLAGGASATFEMRVVIPSGASPGTGGITWQLGQRGPAVKAQFQIAP